MQNESSERRPDDPQPSASEPQPSAPQPPREKPEPARVEVEAEPAKAGDGGKVYEAPPNPFRSAGGGAAGASAGAGGGAGSPGGSASAASGPAPRREWAVACHLVGLLDFGISVFGIGIIVTTALWLLKRGEDPEADFHGKESLNLQLNILFWQIVSIPLLLCIVGIPILLLSPIVKLVALLVGAVNASEGKRWSYPYVYRIVR